MLARRACSTSLAEIQTHVFESLVFEIRAGPRDRAVVNGRDRRELYFWANRFTSSFLSELFTLKTSYAIILRTVTLQPCEEVFDALITLRFISLLHHCSRR